MAAGGAPSILLPGRLLLGLADGLISCLGAELGAVLGAVVTGDGVVFGLGGGPVDVVMSFSTGCRGNQT